MGTCAQGCGCYGKGVGGGMLHQRNGGQASGAAQRARVATVQCGAYMPSEGRAHGRASGEMRRGCPKPTFLFFR